MDTRTDSEKYLWLAAGAALGAAIGLLYAPKSGAATRAVIGGSASRRAHAITDGGRDLFDRGRELYEQGRIIAEEAAELFEEGRRMMQSGPTEDESY
jgi:gas vesicle protein